MKKIDYEKKQFEEQKETNVLLWVNTIATLGAFLFLILEYFK